MFKDIFLKVKCLEGDLHTLTKKVIFRMKEALKAFPLVYVEMEPGD